MSPLNRRVTRSDTMPRTTRPWLMRSTFHYLGMSRQISKQITDAYKVQFRFVSSPSPVPRTRLLSAAGW